MSRSVVKAGELDCALQNMPSKETRGDTFSKTHQHFLVLKEALIEADMGLPSSKLEQRRQTLNN